MDKEDQQIAVYLGAMATGSIAMIAGMYRLSHKIGKVKSLSLYALLVAVIMTIVKSGQTPSTFIDEDDGWRIPK